MCPLVTADIPSTGVRLSMWVPEDHFPMDPYKARCALSRLLLMNGPNLGILGRRQPEIYGTDTLADIEGRVAEEVTETRLEIEAFQHDGEAEMLRTIQADHDTACAIINPAALTTAGWGLGGVGHRLPARALPEKAAGS
uniref:3-dehydroquinate dehydratase n=1 Tax=Streptomyces collinus TaxID=42684 RepID=Q9X658_STRCU|nr:aminodehydroquinate dehydratase [Streptomyces collinus]